jgi:uncharacterized protein YndB with AHSA1/START domain
MKNAGTLAVSTPSAREVVLTRVFDAPRELVEEAFRTPQLLGQWFGPRGWRMTECTMDWREGGRFRFLLQGPEGGALGISGVYRELGDARTVHTETFDGYPGESVVTTELIADGERTMLRATIEYASEEIRDAVIRSGMEHGAAETYDRLAEMLAR